MTDHIRTHKDLAAWKKSMELVIDVYRTTKDFPKEEIYGITNQMRRAAVSVPSNIAEGATRGHKKEFVQFLYVALGSMAELETQIIICRNLKYLSEEKNLSLLKSLTELILIIKGLISSLN